MNMNMEELKKTYEKFGAIYPVLIDKDGKPIDGFHRIQIDPNWPTMKIDTDDEAKKQMIALVANVQRREVNGTEITKKLDAIAELTGWKPSKIAEELGMSHKWVLDYISDKYKDVEMQRRVNERLTLADTDFSPATELNQPESTITEEENQALNELEERKMVIIFPPKVLGVLEKEAKKYNLDVRHLVMRIVRKWAERK